MPQEAGHIQPPFLKPLMSKIREAEIALAEAAVTIAKLWGVAPGGLTNEACSRGVGLEGVDLIEKLGSHETPDISECVPGDGFRDQWAIDKMMAEDFTRLREERDSLRLKLDLATAAMTQAAESAIGSVYGTSDSESCSYSVGPVDFARVGEIERSEDRSWIEQMALNLRFDLIRAQKWVRVLASILPDNDAEAKKAMGGVLGRSKGEPPVDDRPTPQAPSSAPISAESVPDVRRGKACSLCKAPASFKVTEEIPYTDPRYGQRPPFTSYRCQTCLSCLS